MNRHSSLLQPVNGRNGSLFCRDGTRLSGTIQLQEGGIAAMVSEDRGTIVTPSGLLAVLAQLEREQQDSLAADPVCLQLSDRLSIEGFVVNSDGVMLRLDRVTLTIPGGDSNATHPQDLSWVALVPRIRVPSSVLLGVDRTLERLGRGCSTFAAIDLFETPGTSY